ncbi:MAP3K12-binding inhibitory protein 1 [Sardina pilchardus]|uniref:MAP3K12-binding inhibitory protein 1 n=1 Tax=Sardina pilchardus TaxID=27697 RepID=UPI002E1630DB
MRSKGGNTMAEKTDMNERATSECKHDQNANQMSLSGKPAATFSDSFTALIRSLTDFSSELKVGPAVLSITADVSRADIQAFQPTHVYSCLERHISKLQIIAADLKLLSERESKIKAPEEDNEVSVGHAGDEVAETVEEMVVDSDQSPHISHCPANDLSASKTQVDDHIVQIKAGKAEIERRISAFIERKQLEINENNVREFCNVIDCNQENSCARTDAVFTPYPGFKSHVKVTRVVNTYGPQSRAGTGAELREHQQGGLPRNCGNSAIEERLQNMEGHLKLPTAGPVPLSVYQRLKKLEDRILELEGLSPEYFQSVNYVHKRAKHSVSQAYSLTELDGKINAVKSALLKRVSEFRHSETGDFSF